VSAAGWLDAAAAVPLLDVLDALGLVSERRDRRTRPHDCPACARPGVSAAAARWHCFGCGAGGGGPAAVAWHQTGRKWATGDAETSATVRDWYAARGWCDAASNRPPPAPVAPKRRRSTAPPKAAPAYKLGTTWPALRAARNTARARAWAEARGATGEALDAVVRAFEAEPDACAIAPGLMRPAGCPEVAWDALRARTPSGSTERAAVVWLRRDDTGAPCSLALRRVSGPWAKAKSLTLTGAPAGWLGDVGAAAAALAGGAAVHLAEGEPDAIALRAALPPGACILGVASGSWGTAARALGAALGERRPLGRVVLWPDADAPGTAAAQAAQAALADAGLRWARVDVSTAGGDVWAAMLAAGLDGLRSLLDAAERGPEPPLVAATPLDGWAVRAAVADAIEGAQAGCPSVVALPPGMGKSTALRPEVARLVAAGWWCVVVVANHSQAAEAAAGLAAHGVTRVHRARGLTRKEGDAYLCRALAELDPPDAARLVAVHEAHGRSPAGACDGCPYRSTCDVYQLRPAGDDAAVVVAVEAQAAAVLGALPRGARVLVAFDDCGTHVTTAEVKRAALDGLRAALRRTGAAAAAEVAGRALEVLDALERACDAAARRVPRPAGERAHRVWLDAAKLGPDLIRELGPDLIHELGPRPRAGVNVTRGPGGRAQLQAIYATADAVPRDGWATLKAAQAAARGEPSPLALVVAPDGGWSLELRSPPAARAALARSTPPAVVVLDGTAGLEPVRYGALELPVRSLPVRRAEVCPVTWWPLGSADAGALALALDCDDRLMPCDRAGAAIGAAVRRWAAAVVAAREPGPVSVITLKATADALRSLLDDRAAPGGALAEAAAVLRELDDLGWPVSIGHYGADGRGSNAHAAAVGLLTLGTWRSPVGAAACDAAALGLPAEVAAGLVAERATAEVVQAVARARHVRRTAGEMPVIHVVASVAPPPVGDALPGVAWSVQRAHGGAARADLVPSLALMRAAVADATARGWVAPALLDATRPLAEAAAEMVGRARGWNRQAGGGRGRPLHWSPGQHFSDVNQALGRLTRGTANRLAQPVETPSEPPPLVLMAVQGVIPASARNVDGLCWPEHRADLSPAEVAGELVAACDLMTATAALAEVLTGAEAYAEATGADWPPRGWSAPPGGSIPAHPSANGDAPPASLPRTRPAAPPAQATAWPPRPPPSPWPVPWPSPWPDPWPWPTGIQGRDAEICA
jgi:hypothetical protein